MIKDEEMEVFQDKNVEEEKPLVLQKKLKPFKSEKLRQKLIKLCLQQ